MSSHVLDHAKPYCKYFEEISAIPRGSNHEEKIAAYHMNFAYELKLDAYEDNMHNVVIYKPATNGKLDEDVVMLQSHIDMVWEKDKDIDFDFLKEPLKLQVNDGWLSATGTTLGADDGAGVAYMMSILADRELQHPTLVCVFTVQEETGLDGAKGIDPELLQGANYMINLDHGGDNSTCTSNSGGLRVWANFKYTYEETDEIIYKVIVENCKGGHSGGMITKNRANANKLLARVLYEIRESYDDTRIVSINGGQKDNAIPRDAEAVIATSGNKALYDVIEKCQKDFSDEYQDSDPDVTVRLVPYPKTNQCFSKKTTDDIINFMYHAPNGLQALSQSIEGLPICSLNMGIVSTEKDKVMVHFALRSPIDSSRRYMRQQLEALGQLFDGEVYFDSEYPGWNYDPASKLRGILKDALKEVRGLDLVEEATHGGLETGIFKSYLPDLDIITMGPNMVDIHTPRERLDLHSFDECYKVLKRVLEKI